MFEHGIEHGLSFFFSSVLVYLRTPCVGIRLPISGYSLSSSELGPSFSDVSLTVTEGKRQVCIFGVVKWLLPGMVFVPITLIFHELSD